MATAVFQHSPRLMMSPTLFAGIYGTRDLVNQYSAQLMATMKHYSAVRASTLNPQI